MRNLQILAALLAASVITMVSACSTAGPQGNVSVPPPAKAVDLERYLGRWYELARYENGFEKDCEGVTADYSKRADGRVAVLNTCRKGSPNGEVKRAKGTARIVENSQGAKLKVSFFGPFEGDYWVLDRAEDYSWSIVGEPSGRYLWILVRDATPSPGLKTVLKERVASLGYNLSLLRETKQPPA